MSELHEQILRVYGCTRFTHVYDEEGSLLYTRGHAK